jgi:hypothetical protein
LRFVNPIIFCELKTSANSNLRICDFRNCTHQKLRICDCGISPRTKKNCVPTFEALHEYYCILYLVSPLLPGLTNCGRVDRSLILVSQRIFRQIIAHLCWGVSHMVEAPGRILDQHGLYCSNHHSGAKGYDWTP